MDFYLSNSGDDAFDGTAPERAWRSMARAGRAAYSPGDRLLLQRGDRWCEPLELRGVRGAPGRPVVIGAYGEGPLPALRRTGAKETLVGRVGRRFDLGLLAGRTELERFARILRHELEVRIYRLFGQVDVLKRPGNRELFGLLCRMRSQIARPLTQLLTVAFSEIPGESPEQIPFHFAGCYVAATGGESDQRAFGPALLPRLLESQDHLQWSETGLARSRSQRVWQTVAGIAIVLLLGLLVRELLTWFSGGQG